MRKEARKKLKEESGFFKGETTSHYNRRNAKTHHEEDNTRGGARGPDPGKETKVKSLMSDSIGKDSLIEREP